MGAASGRGGQESAPQLGGLRAAARHGRRRRGRRRVRHPAAASPAGFGPAGHRGDARHRGGDRRGRHRPLYGGGERRADPGRRRLDRGAVEPERRAAAGLAELGQGSRPGVLPSRLPGLPGARRGDLGYRRGSHYRDDGAARRGRGAGGRGHAGPADPDARHQQTRPDAVRALAGAAADAHPGHRRRTGPGHPHLPGPRIQRRRLHRRDAARRPLPGGAPGRCGGSCSATAATPPGSSSPTCSPRGPSTFASTTGSPARTAASKNRPNGTRSARRRSRTSFLRRPRTRQILPRYFVISELIASGGRGSGHRQVRSADGGLAAAAGNPRLPRRCPSRHGGA